MARSIRSLVVNVVAPDGQVAFESRSTPDGQVVSPLLILVIIASPDGLTRSLLLCYGGYPPDALVVLELCVPVHHFRCNPSDHLIRYLLWLVVSFTGGHCRLSR